MFKFRFDVCVFGLVMGLSSNLSASVITHFDQQQNKKYPTAPAYILDKFRCAVEFGRGLHIMSVGKDRKFDYPFNWGIRLGYYLYKYHHVPAKPGDFKPYYVYNSFTKQRELIEPRGGISREGEGSILEFFRNQELGFLGRKEFVRNRSLLR